MKWFASICVTSDTEYADEKLYRLATLYHFRSIQKKSAHLTSFWIMVNAMCQLMKYVKLQSDGRAVYVKPDLTNTKSRFVQLWCGPEQNSKHMYFPTCFLMLAGVFNMYCTDNDEIDVNYERLYMMDYHYFEYDVELGVGMDACGIEVLPDYLDYLEVEYDDDNNDENEH